MKRSRSFVLIGMLIILVLGVYSATKITFNFDLSTFASEDSQEYKNYEEYRNKFPMHPGGVSVMIGFDRSISEKADFEKIEQLTEELLSLSVVEEATSITSIRLPRNNILGFTKRRIISTKNQAAFNRKFNRLNDYPDITPKFISLDGTVTCIYLKLVSDASYAQISSIKNVVEKHRFPEVYYSGSELLNVEANNQYKSEIYRLPLIAGIALLFFFLLFFKDVKSLLLVAMFLLLNAALVLIGFWIFGLEIGALTVTVPLLILVLAFCDIVHMLYVFKTSSEDLEIRLKSTTSTLSYALFLTSLTTFVAFAVFMFSGANPIVEFGMITCFGVATSYLSIRYLFPVCMVWMNVSPFSKIPMAGLVKALKKSVERPNWKMALALVLVFTLGASVYSNFSIDNHTTKELGESFGTGVDFYNEHFAGSRSIEVIINEENVLNRSTLDLVDTIEKQLIHEYGCRSVFSVNTAIKRLNRFNHFGVTSYYRLPDSIDKTFWSQLKSRRDELGLLDAVSEDYRTLKIVGHLPEVSVAEAKQKNVDLEHFLDSLKENNRRMFISGYSYVADQSLIHVTELILFSVIFCLLLAATIIGFVFKSLRVMIAMLVPNTLPLLSALVIMPLLNIDLNPFSAMALSIMLGLSIDDTIYIASHALKGKKKDRLAELRSALELNSFPVIVTTSLLVVGFATLNFSAITSNQNIGTLVSIVLVIALISDLIFLPAMLNWALKKKE